MKREMMWIKATELFIIQLRYSEAKRSIGRYAGRYAGRNAGRYGEEHKEGQIMMRSWLGW